MLLKETRRSFLDYRNLEKILHASISIWRISKLLRDILMSDVGVHSIQHVYREANISRRTCKEGSI